MEKFKEPFYWFKWTLHKHHKEDWYNHSQARDEEIETLMSQSDSRIIVGSECCSCDDPGHILGERIFCDTPYWPNYITGTPLGHVFEHWVPFLRPKHYRITGSGGKLKVRLKKGDRRENFVLWLALPQC